MRAENIDFIGLVETLKPSFFPYELSAIAGIDRFRWNFVASVGQSAAFFWAPIMSPLILWLSTMVYTGLVW